MGEFDLEIIKFTLEVFFYGNKGKCLGRLAKPYKALK